MKRLDSDKSTIRLMVNYYCRKCHGSHCLCPSCAELLDYAIQRLDKCPWGDRKPTCRRCTIHCYKPSMRLRMREIMRYAAPRMLLINPIALLRHMNIFNR